MNSLPFISYGVGFCFVTKLDGVWIFEPHEEGDWFYYNGYIYKIRNPADAGIYFNDKALRFKINEKKLRYFLKVSWKGGNWTFSKLEWGVESYFPKEVWDFGEGKGVLDRWEDIDGFIKVVKEWLTGRGGKPIFDLEGEVDLPVEGRYRKVLGDGEHVKVVARHDIDGDGEEEVVIATAVDKDWRSPGYAYIWKDGRLLLKYTLGSMPRLSDNAIKPAVVKFRNLNKIDWDEIIVFWMHVLYYEKYESFLIRVSFTIFSLDDLKELCDPWGKLEKAKEEYEKSGGSKNK